MRFKNIFYTLLFSAFLILSNIGCTTMDHVENAEGTGHKIVFNKDYETVWAATLSVLGTLPLDLKKND